MHTNTQRRFINPNRGGSMHRNESPRHSSVFTGAGPSTRREYRVVGKWGECEESIGAGLGRAL